MKRRKSNLDGQQERKLLEIESRGCWMAFWGLVIALFVEALVIRDVRAIAGEWILFMGLAVYLTVSCIRAGIWDRRMDMSRKTILTISVIVGLCIAVFLFGFTFLRHQRLVGALGFAAIWGIGAIVLCYLVLLLAARATQKRHDRLNAEPDDETDAADLR